MKNNQELLEELKVEVDKLQKLLGANHVGLFTWWSFLVDRLNKINEISKKLGIVNKENNRMMPEKPKKDFVELLKHVSYEIEHIDESTPALRTVEPDWWVDMMEIQRKIVECKMKYIEYEV